MLSLVRVALFLSLFMGTGALASFINYSSREINIKIVYYGGAPTKAPTENLEYVYKRTNPEARGKVIDFGGDGAGGKSFDFLPLSLGEIRGFKTRFHLYTTPSAKAFGRSRSLILKGVDGIIFVADADPSFAKANVTSLNELKSHLRKDGYDFDKMPVVFQLVGTGQPGAMDAATMKKALGVGDRPCFEADPSAGMGVFDTLKAVAKLALLELKKPATKND